MGIGVLLELWQIIHLELLWLMEPLGLDVGGEWKLVEAG